MKADEFRKQLRRTPVCGGVHPGGGFVAWPDKILNPAEEKERFDLLKRRRERRGFVAWPGR